jgi:excisionase family DNA binding protein
MDESEYLNGVQAAEYLGVSKQRIYELRDSRRIGRIIGGYWLFTKSELDHYKATKYQRKTGRPKGSRNRKIKCAPTMDSASRGTGRKALPDPASHRIP